MSEDFLTAAQAAEVAKRHVVTIRLALQSGELHGHQRVRGGTWHVSPASIKAWILGIDQKVACGCRSLSSLRRAS